MVEREVNAGELLVLKTAEEYRSKGYDVSMDGHLDFLPGYRPDLIVRKGEEAKVIEVKSRASLSVRPEIRELAQLIDSKPGWSFELILVGEPEKLDSPEGSHSLEREAIIRRVEEAESLLEIGYPHAAFVFAWAACEAAARLMVTAEGVSDTGITRPGYVFDQATFLGLLSRDEYHHLRELQKYRNAIVHGYGDVDFDNGVVTDLTATVRRMIAPI